MKANLLSSGLTSTQLFTIFARATLSDQTHLDKELTFTAQEPPAEVETCNGQTLALVSQDTLTETAVIGSAETILSNLQDLFQSNTQTTTTSILMYAGRKVEENSFTQLITYDNSNGHTQEECVSFALNEPTCANGNGWYSFHANNGSCKCFHSAALLEDGDFNLWNTF